MMGGKMMRGGMKRPGMPMPGTGGINPGMRQPLPVTGGPNVGMRPGMGMGVSLDVAALKNKLGALRPMAAAQVMPGGRAFAKGGMVGCDWSPKSSKTMRGAARKGK
jgi:hypothetical protein